MHRHEANRTAFPLIVGLLCVAFLFGGGGIGAALGNLCVQIVALAVLALNGSSFARFWNLAPIALRLLVAASLALPLLQVIPLPEPVWTALPARDLVARSLESADSGGGWMPFSANPLRTLLAFTALVTPLAVLSVGWSLPRDRLIDLGWIVVALGMLTVLLGVLQLGSQSEAYTLYGSARPGQIVVGTFANRNSTGLFLVMALAFAALLPSPRPHPAVGPIRVAVCALLLITVALTQSRTALVLATLPVLLGAIRAWGGMRGSPDRPSPAGRALIALGALALMLGGLGTVLFTPPGRISATLTRFEAKDDPRRFIWDDASYSAGRYWPTGAGMGTFDEIYQVDESLENLTSRRAGRAHNDYIEITIEAGAVGLALVAGWFLLISWFTWRARGSSQRWPAWAGSASLLAIALQSITDYPLRNQTLLALAALALLLLARIAADQGRSRT